MNYLIFGGSGFIGTHLIHRLKDACVKPGDCIYDLDLVMPGEEGVVPGIVEKNEGVIYRRVDVRKPITADDVMYTYNEVVFRGLGNPSVMDAMKVDGKLPELEKIDDYTVKFTTPRPFAPFLRQIGRAHV